MTPAVTLPFKGIIQTAYIVADLDKAMAEWVDKLGVGPWFASSGFSGTDLTYRGKPTDVNMRIGMSFSGQMNIELIEQINDAPSVYREIADRRGYGFHHWGVASYDFDRDLARYQAQGYELAFSIVLRGARLAYLDTTRDLPGMIELIEMIPAREQMFSEWYAAAREWDGNNPIRPRA